MRSLIKTQIVVNFNISGFKVDKKKALLALAVIIALLPTYLGYIVILAFQFKVIQKSGLDIYDILTSGFYVSIQLILFLLGIIFAYQTLYYSKDLEILLYLPYKPFEIFMAKFTILYLYDLITTLILALPTYIMSLIYIKPDIVIAINSLISIFLLPIIPLFLSSILAVLIANIPKIGKSQWLWNILMILLILIIYFGFIFFFTPEEKNTQFSSLATTKMEQIGKYKNLIPGISFGVDTFIYSGVKGIVSQILNIGTCFIYIAILFVTITKLYLNPILKGIDNSYRRKKSFTIKAANFIKSYVVKEILCTMREPIVAMNGIGGYISIPILLVVYYILGKKSNNEIDIIGELSKIFLNKTNTYIILSVPVIISFFSVSSLFSASYSKDGRKLWIEKSLPIKAQDIFIGKAIANGIIVSVLNIAAYILLNIIIFKLPISISIYNIILSEIIILNTGSIGLIIDVLRPKLNWKNSTEAVKQNMNVVLHMLIMLAYILLNGDRKSTRLNSSHRT